MASVQVGGDHVVAGILHVQIQRDDAEPDPNKAFSAIINGPGFNTVMPVGNGASKTFTLSGTSIAGVPGTNPTILAEVDNFTIVPPGDPAKATAISFLIVFKIVEIFRITIGSVPVHASLK